MAKKKKNEIDMAPPPPNKIIELLPFFLNLFLMVSTVLMLGFVSFKTVEIAQDSCGYCKYGIRNDMYQSNETRAELVRLNGVYFNPYYYCVWTQGREEFFINDTETHEQCHALVQYAPEHFCGEEE